MKKGFALIELLAVMVLIGLLYALYVPAMSRSRESARRVACGNNVRQIGLSCGQFAIDHDGMFPTNVGEAGKSTGCFLALTNGNYLPVGMVYLCPSDWFGRDSWYAHDRRGSFQTCSNSYSYVAASIDGYRGLATNAPPTQPLVLDRGFALGTSLSRRGPALTWKLAHGSPHGKYGGNVYFVDGHAAFRTNLASGFVGGETGYILPAQ